MKIFDKVLNELNLFLDPVISVKKHPYRLIEILSQNNWTEEEFKNIGLEQAVKIATIVQSTIDNIKNAIENQEEAGFDSILTAINDTTQLVHTFSDIGKKDFQLTEVLAKRFAEDIANYLLVNYLKEKSIFVFQCLRLLGIIVQENEQSYFETGLPLIVGDGFPRFNFEQIGAIFKAPGALMEKEYWPNGFSTQEEVEKTAKKLFSKVALILYSLGVNSISLGYQESEDEISDEKKNLLKRSISFYHDFPILVDDDIGSNGLFMVTTALLTKNEAGPGVMILPSGNFAYTHTFNQWAFNIGAGLELGGFKINKKGFSFIEKNVGKPGINFKASVSKLKEENSEYVFLIGQEKGTRFSIKNYDINGGLKLSPSYQNYSVYTKFKELSLVISGKDGDGFISKILGDNEINISVDLEIGYSNKGGFHIKGSGGLEFVFPLHIDLGPIGIDNLLLAIYFKENGISIIAGSTFSAALGPVALSVERIGLQTKIPFSKEEQFDLGFKPPNGIGIDIDASMVKGGGYLYIEPEKGQYAGVAELTIKEMVSLKAIAIITTKNPDGTEGYSFLMIISAEFTPIQIGFGFTLNGVGGLIGINRGVATKALVQGVRTGSIDNIMFPDDPVANAPRIIADMNAFFPIGQNQYTFGFMGKLGWGTPESFISIELGLILSFPNPVKFNILGVIKAMIPTEEAAVVKLQINFLGEINFTEEYMFFFASIFDSSILTFTLEGDMYFSLDWGENPNFIFSIGGFHPDYKSPPLRGDVGTLKRIKLSLLGDAENPSLILTFYLAVTSNTVQFGASLDLLIDIEIFSIQGWLHFDALFQFDPFYMKVSISAGLVVKIGDEVLFEISFSGTIEGPTPWHIYGQAQFGFFFFSIKVNVDTTFGEEKTILAPKVALLPIIEQELELDQNWRTQPPASQNLLVSVRKLEEAVEQNIAHPNSTISFSQNKIPLALDLDIYGHHEPEDYASFDLDLLDDAEQPLEKESVKDLFAPAQFKILSEEEKITSASFELLTAGIQAKNSTKITTSAPVTKINLHEESLIDDPLEIEAKPTSAIFYAPYIHATAIAHSEIGIERTAAKIDQYQAQLNQQFTINDEQFVIVNSADLTEFVHRAIPPSFDTEIEAEDALKELIKRQPELSNQLIVMADYELVD